jgi:hypothetical protein
MPSTIMFKSTGLPGGTNLTLNHGTDIIVKPPNESHLHITFHANRATHVGGLVTLSYNASAWYHVTVRLGVYFARKFQNGRWEDDAEHTKGNFASDKREAMEYALDIEQILAVT